MVARNDGGIRVAISDRGSGIPEEFRPRIFQKFAQAEGSNTGRKGSTGLGLSIAKALVERMGGQIGFETARGVGTTFYIDLPEWRAEPETTNADENQTTAFVIVPCTPNLNNYQGKG